MLRYVAFAWNTCNETESNAAQLLRARLLPTRVSQWRCVVDLPGMQVFYCGARPDGSNVHLLPDNAGVVLGDIFDSSALLLLGNSRTSPRFGVREAARLVSSAGRDLVDFYWGAYVAFLHDSRTDRKWALRGPMGELQCLNASFRGVQVYFSRTEDCVALGLLRLSVNWSYVAAHVALGMPCTRETGIREVAAVEGGECMEIQASGTSRSFYWHPCDIAGSATPGDMSLAVRELRNVTKACIAARASTHNAILHRFSGGLDSSIVLAALRGAPASPEVIPLHYYYTAGAFGDERQYARAVARHVNCELIERERNPQADLRRVQTIGRTASPVLDFSEFDAYRPEVQLAAERGATAIFCGEHGDAIFSRAPVMPCAADYVALHGASPGLLKIALDVARIERVSLWKSLKFALQNGAAKRRTAYWRECMLARCTPQTAAMRLMNPHAMEECRRNIDRFIHPWLRSVGNTPPGKLWMIFALTGNCIQNNPYAEPADPPIVAPLASQPLVELCLRTPSYFNTADGWDRAMARRAFAPDLPIEIIQRMAKGASNSWSRDVVRRNIDFVREFLLEGMLVREGLLDRRKLEEALPGVVAKSNAPGGGRIQEHLCTEAWLRAWTEVERRAAA